PWPSLARRRAQDTSRGGTVRRALVGHRSNLRLGSPRRVAPPRTVTLLEARGGRPLLLPLEGAPFRPPAPHHPVDVPEGVPEVPNHLPGLGKHHAEPDAQHAPERVPQQRLPRAHAASSSSWA